MLEMLSDTYIDADIRFSFEFSDTSLAADIYFRWV